MERQIIKFKKGESIRNINRILLSHPWMIIDMMALGSNKREVKKHE